MPSAMFLLCANGDLLLFGSGDSVTRYVESPDIDSGEYVCAYDETGQRYSLELEQPTRRKRVLGIEVIGLAPVVLRATGLSEPDVLGRLLSTHLNCADGDLDLLVEKARRVWPEH
jgi:hypothetical protein